MSDDATRQRILRVSLERFLLQGFSKITTDELAQELGISKKTLYKHFPSKDALVEAAVDLFLAQILEHVNEVGASREKLMSKLQHFLAHMGKTLSRLSKRFQEDLRRTRPDLWKRMETFRRERVLTLIGKLIEEGIELGVVRSDIHKEIVLLTYVSAIQGILNPDVLTTHSFSAEQAFREILQTLFCGILTDPGRRSYRKTMAASEKKPAL